jgi:hypothetical protein
MTILFYVPFAGAVVYSRCHLADLSLFKSEILSLRSHQKVTE